LGLSLLYISYLLLTGNRRVKGIEAGMHSEMLGNDGVNCKKIVEDVKNGYLSETRLDELVTKLLTIIFKTYDKSKS
jgi:hypothetical protein